MSAIEQEVASQPAVWLEAGLLDTDGLLPPRGARVAAIGCGTSLYIAQAYAAVREAGGHGETDAFPASEIPAGRAYDAVLAISRSGTTTEVLDAVAEAGRRTRTVAVSAVTGSPLAQAVSRAVLLPFADERSVVQTRFATTTLALLRAQLGEDLAHAIADAHTTVEADLPDGALDRGQFTFLGRHWTVGLANEAALKMREASLSWSESYPAMEYRHGPISIGDKHSLVWMLGAPPDGLRAEVEATGATWVESNCDPMAELIRAQRLAVAVGRGRGLDPDNPRNLTRSVILDPA